MIDVPLYDSLFGAARDNTEGVVLDAKPFDETTVMELLYRQPMQAAGAALLGLAWKHRDFLV